MPSVFAEYRAVPFQSVGRPRKHAWAKFAVGSAGAVTKDATFSDPGIELGNFSTGVAALTFPSAVKGIVKVTYQPNAVTDDNHVVTTAQDVTLGTATLTCHDDGTAENPSSGAVVWVEIVAEPRG
jgi:hypothetical protein